TIISRGGFARGRHLFTAFFPAWHPSAETQHPILSSSGSVMRPRGKRFGSIGNAGGWWFIRNILKRNWFAMALILRKFISTCPFAAKAQGHPAVLSANAT